MIICMAVHDVIPLIGIKGEFEKLKIVFFGCVLRERQLSSPYVQVCMEWSYHITNLNVMF